MFSNENFNVDRWLLSVLIIDFRPCVHNQKAHDFDPEVIRTRNLLIWSQTRYRCATESHLFKWVENALHFCCSTFSFVYPLQLGTQSATSCAKHLFYHASATY